MEHCESQRFFVVFRNRTLYLFDCSDVAPVILRFPEELFPFKDSADLKSETHFSPVPHRFLSWPKGLSFQHGRLSPLGLVSIVYRDGPSGLYHPPSVSSWLTAFIQLPDDGKESNIILHSQTIKTPDDSSHEFVALSPSMLLLRVRPKGGNMTTRYLMLRFNPVKNVHTLHELELPSNTTIYPEGIPPESQSWDQECRVHIDEGLGVIQFQRGLLSFSAGRDLDVCRIFALCFTDGHEGIVPASESAAEGAYYIGMPLEFPSKYPQML